MKKALIAALIIFVLLLFSFCGKTDDATVQNDDTQVTVISEIDEDVSELTDETTTEETTKDIKETTVETTTEEASEVLAVVPTEVPTEAPTETPTEAPTEAPIVSTTKAETMVWTPSSGSKYHRSSSCSNMKNPSQVTLEKAQRLGYEPCKKCY